MRAKAAWTSRKKASAGRCLLLFLLLHCSSTRMSRPTPMLKWAMMPTTASASHQKMALRRRTTSPSSHCYTSQAASASASAWASWVPRRCYCGSRRCGEPPLPTTSHRGSRDPVHQQRYPVVEAEARCCSTSQTVQDPTWPSCLQLLLQPRRDRTVLLLLQRQPRLEQQPQPPSQRPRRPRPDSTPMSSAETRLLPSAASLLACCLPPRTQSSSADPTPPRRRRRRLLLLPPRRQQTSAAVAGHLQGGDS